MLRWDAQACTFLSGCYPAPGENNGARSAPVRLTEGVLSTMQRTQLRIGGLVACRCVSHANVHENLFPVPSATISTRIASAALGHFCSFNSGNCVRHFFKLKGGCRRRGLSMTSSGGKWRKVCRCCTAAFPCEAARAAQGPSRTSHLSEFTSASIASTRNSSPRDSPWGRATAACSFLSVPLNSLWLLVRPGLGIRLGCVVDAVRPCGSLARLWLPSSCHSIPESGNAMIPSRKLGFSC